MTAIIFTMKKNIVCDTVYISVHRLSSEVVMCSWWDTRIQVVTTVLLWSSGDDPMLLLRYLNPRTAQRQTSWLTWNLPVPWMVVHQICHHHSAPQNLQLLCLRHLLFVWQGILWKGNCKLGRKSWNAQSWEARHAGEMDQPQMKTLGRVSLWVLKLRLRGWISRRWQLQKGAAGCARCVERPSPRSSSLTGTWKLMQVCSQTFKTSGSRDCTL